jgi:hypothetical protein
MKKLLLLITAVFILLGCTKDRLSKPNSENIKSTGASASDFLSSSKFNKLTVELVSVNGFELTTNQINSFKNFIELLVNKPNGITINQKIIDSPGLAPYSSTSLRSFEDNTRTKFNSDNELMLFIYITEGSYTDNNVLGVAYRNTSFALFGGRIAELTGGIGKPSKDLVLQSVLRHEMGHLLGLVNLGTPMQSEHHDNGHKHHCTEKSCLMYYAVESGDFLSNLIGVSSPPELDSQCRADLKANGGK